MLGFLGVPRKVSTRRLKLKGGIDYPADEEQRKVLVDALHEEFGIGREVAGILFSPALAKRLKK